MEYHTVHSNTSDMADKMSCFGVISLVPDVKHMMPRGFRRAMLLN